MSSSPPPTLDGLASTGRTDEYSTGDYTTWSGDGGEPSPMGVVDYWQFQLHYNLLLYTSPILIILGTVGNLITFVTLRHPLYRNSSTGFLLSALALVDTGMLNTGLLRHWIRMITDGWLDIRALSEGSCKMHYFFTYFLKQVSPMTVILMTMERVISVVRPFKVKEICSRRNIKIAWFLLTLLLVLSNIHGLWTMILYYEEVPREGQMVNFSYCYNTESSENFHRGAWYWIDGMLTNFLPFVLILGGNVVIIVKIAYARRNRESDMKVKAKEAGSTKGTTIMLLVVCVMFLLTTTPASIYFLGIGNLGWWPQRTAEDIAKISLAYAVVNILFYANNAGNFLLYCLSGSRFRRALKATLCCSDASLLSTYAARGTTSASNMNMSVTEVSKI